MKHACLIIACLCLSLMAAAMDQRLEHINSIKKDTAYLYSDVTLPTAEVAASLAYEQLQREVLSWVEQESVRKPEGFTVVEINRLADTVMTRRANMYRVFAYVKKQHVLQLFRGEEIQKETVAPEREEAQTVELPSVNQPATEAIPVKKDSAVSNEVRQLLLQNFVGRNGRVLEQIKKARSFFELKQIMEPLKKSGDILEYGKYATAEKPEDCYLIVYDAAGNIRALLGKGKESRRNLKTGKPDSITNYRGCGAIWFKLNE